jgi:hypothetical protein
MGKRKIIKFTVKVPYTEEELNCYLDLTDAPIKYPYLTLKLLEDKYKKICEEAIEKTIKRIVERGVQTMRYKK